MKSNVILVAIVHKNYKTILLIKRAREPYIGKWALPGGFGALIKEKNISKAIKKEIYDDMGVDYDSEIYNMIFIEGKQPEIEIVFQGRIKGKPFVKSKKTIADIKWFKLVDALKLPLAFQDRKILKNFKRDFCN
jgi:ADP-ribose pyrophosphatase YjhB (NUDIX family)